jgi:hypothetical protein
MANPIAVPGTVVPSGSLTTPGGAQGIQGPTAISTDAGNIATLGSDSLISVPQSSIWSVRLRSFQAIGNNTFEVDQVNVGNTVAAIGTNVRLADRWLHQKTGTMVGSAGQVAAPVGGIVVPGTSFQISRSYLRYTLTTAQVTLAVGDALIPFLQYVEGPQWRELCNDVHSVSLLVRTSVAGLAFSVTLRDPPTPTKSLTQLCTIPNANTWTLITLPNLPVWPTGNFTTAPGSVGYMFEICLGAGTTFTAPAGGTWQNGNFHTAPGTTNFAASAVNSTFDIAYISHEPGALCSNPPMDCSFTQNYDDCLRFFQKTFDYDIAIGTAAAIGQIYLMQITTTSLVSSVRFTKPMAKNPAMTGYNQVSGAINSVRLMNGSDYAISSFGGIGKSGFGSVATATLPAVVAGMAGNLHYTADTGM